jgi:hypothetical protein
MGSGCILSLFTQAPQEQYMPGQYNPHHGVYLFLVTDRCLFLYLACMQLRVVSMTFAECWWRQGPLVT